MHQTCPRLFSFLGLALAAVVSAIAQTATSGTGTVAGRVFNPTTREYVRNAEVSVAGTDLRTTTETGGYFRLDRVPAGDVTINVTYTGYAPASAAMRITAGEVSTRDLEISPSADDGVVQLQSFVVSSEREGNAKALQQQKNSMTIGRSVASDVFGDVTEGNVGEFLKYLPGVELEYVEADTRGPRLGGLGSEYASVSMDGMKLASADAFTQYVAFENTPAGGANRSFGFEQVSIQSIESIEINRVTSAAMDADAPAGNINMKTKRAFDSKGRRIGYSVGTVLNTEEFHLRRSAGPNDTLSHKVRPNYSLNYADTFFNQRLGVVIGLSESNLYNEQYRVDHTYNRTAVAGDTRPQVLTQILLKDGPKWTERFTGTFTTDLKATSDLTLSFTAIFNSYDARFYNRQVTMQAAANNTGATTGRQTVAGDGFLSYGTTAASTAASRQIVFGGGNGVKLTNTINLIPKFEYRWGNFLFDGALAYSHSRNDYDNIARGTVGNTSVNNLQGVGFSASRSGADEADWQFTQTGGLDWTDLSAQTNPRISDDNRRALNDVWTSELNARWTTPLSIPTFLRVGAKQREFYYKVSNSNPYDVWSYVGPGGNTATTTTGTFALYPSPIRLYDGGNQVGARFTSLSGGGAPAFPNRDALGRLFHSNPEYFLRNETVVNATAYEQGVYTNTRDLKETITAGYLMANSQWRQLQLQSGIRYEETQVDSKEWDPRSPTEIRTAGFPVTAAGVPTTWAGMDYKYNSQPRATRTGKYHNYFPSVTAKYRVRENLLADIGWGRTIKRPNVNLLSGVWSINDDAQTVTASNPNLLPEISEKVVGALGYYFGRNGSSHAQVVLTNNRIRNQTAGRVYTSDEFGNTDPAYLDYDFISFTNTDRPVRFRSLEASYNQQLSFLPSFLRGTSVNLAYTRTYASERVAGLVPHSLKGGINYRYRFFNMSFNGVWRDETPWFQGTTNRFLKENVKFDVSGAFRINRAVSLYFTGRNIFEEPHRIYERTAGMPDALFRYENYGTNWSFGMRGTF